MSILTSSFQTVTCNGKDCKHTVTFELKENGAPTTDPSIENPWLKTVRVVQAAGRNFCYCNDTCELSGVESGLHNPPEQKKIIAPLTPGEAQTAIAQAAAHAKAAEQANRDLHAGKVSLE